MRFRQLFFFYYSHSCSFLSRIISLLFLSLQSHLYIHDGYIHCHLDCTFVDNVTTRATLVDNVTTRATLVEIVMTKTKLDHDEYW
jgi:hypothetical protein